MTAFSPAGFRLLFRECPNTTGLARKIAAIDRNLLHDEYGKLMVRAPRRADRDKQWFVPGHDGRLANGVLSAWREKHVARALWNCKGAWSLPSGGRFRLLDYEFSLHAHRSDGAGKIDLVGVATDERFIAIEMKVHGKRTGSGSRSIPDKPVTALLQGLRYAAIVEANLTDIAEAARQSCNEHIAEKRPTVQVLATKICWNAWMGIGSSQRKAIPAWERELAKLVADIETRIGIAVQCLALDADHTDLRIGCPKPIFKGVPALCQVRPGELDLFGPALPWRPDAARP